MFLVVVAVLLGSLEVIAGVLAAQMAVGVVVSDSIGLEFVEMI